MKKRSWILLALPIVFVACNNEAKDSVEKADSANESKMDTSSNTTKTIAVDESTSDFMVTVADVGMTEVELGQIAQQKSANQQVKNFGAMMVEDHSKAGGELKSLAARKNVTLPATIGEEHKKKIDNLSKKSGKDFDKAYMDMMVEGHEATVKDFENASSNTKDADVKAWVDQTLPILKKHLDSAKAIRKAIK